jgi:CBS domain-containing protein
VGPVPPCCALCWTAACAAWRSAPYSGAEVVFAAPAGSGLLDGGVDGTVLPQAASSTTAAAARQPAVSRLRIVNAINRLIGVLGSRGERARRAFDSRTARRLRRLWFSAQMPDGVIHLSSLVGSPLLDSANERLGRVDDIVARLDGSETLPPVIGLRALIGGRNLFVPARNVARLEADSAQLSTTKLNLAQFERRPNEVLLRGDLLGHSVINVNTARLVNAGDVELVRDGDTWRLAGIDTSLGARVRRRLPRALRSSGGADEGFVAWDQLEPFVGHVPTARLRLRHRRLAHLHPSQIADLVEAASHDEGEEILAAVGQDKELEADVFEELDDEHQLEFLNDRSDREVASVLARMASDDAADLLLEIKQERRLPVLELLPATKQRKIRKLLGYNPSTAGGVMSPDFVAVAARGTAADAMAAARKLELPPEALHTVLLTDKDGTLCGLVSAGVLIAADPTTPLLELGITSPPSVAPEADVPEVARLMTDYNLVSLPVVDGEERPIGIVSVDDVLELMLPEDWRRRYGLARE